MTMQMKTLLFPEGGKATRYKEHWLELQPRVKLPFSLDRERESHSSFSAGGKEEDLAVSAA